MEERHKGKKWRQNFGAVLPDCQQRDLFLPMFSFLLVEHASTPRNRDLSHMVTLLVRRIGKSRLELYVKVFIGAISYSELSQRDRGAHR